MDDVKAANDFRERLAVLEERTKPKKKTLLDEVKNYGGIIALLITIAYSWPLGVWDRFVLTPTEKREARIANLRDILADSVTILAESARSVSTITEPMLYDIVARSYNNQLLLIMTKHKAAFIAEKKYLSTEELIMIGLNFQYVYQLESALEFFQFAADRSDKTILMQIEANRQIGKSYFLPSEFQDVELGRKHYREILRQFSGSRDIRLIGLEITLRSEWGFFEMTQGDWTCGETQMEKALAMIYKWQHSINDQGNMARLLSAKRSALSPVAGQPKQGCD